MKLTPRTVKIICILLLALALPSFSACAEWNLFGETATEQGSDTETETETELPSAEGLEYRLTDGSGYSVVGIGTCTDTEVVIPSEYGGLPVTRIHNYAFYNCKNVQSVTIPSSVTGIGGYAFYGCTGLTSVMIPSGVTGIGEYAFLGCSGLSSVTFPNSVTSIGGNAFNGCTGLTDITVPNSVTSIGRGAFSGCTGLESITVPFVGREISGTSQTYFGYIFGAGRYNDNAANVPASLHTVVISEGARNIGGNAFFGCENVCDITVPSSVTHVGKDAFSGTGWYDAQPDGVVYVGSVAYKYKGTCPSDVALKDGTAEITESAFRECDGLTCITVPSSVTYIGKDAFYGCTGLNRVNMTDVVAWCGIQFVNDYSNPIYMAHYLYLNGSQVINLVIPEGVTGIGKGAFRGCTLLASIEIPDSVTAIGAYAFHNTAWYKDRPSGMVYAGKVAYGYKGTCPETVTLREDTVGIASSAFAGCTKLTDITVPSSVTNIGGYAFNNCKKLANVTLPESVTVIDEYTFCNCVALVGIALPSGVTGIGAHAFDGCTGLLSIAIPSGVTDVGQYAFRDCKGLANVVIPEGVTAIGQYTFRGCTGLLNIVLPSGVTSIGTHAFDGCTALESITFAGTRTQWEEIKKGTGWRTDVPVTRVHCSDGNASL